MNLSPGDHALHFNQNTGRVVRVVEIIDIRGEAATVEAINGKRKGDRYPVSLAALYPADAPEV